MTIEDDALAAYTASGSLARPEKSDLVALFAQLNDVAHKEAANIFDASNTFQTITDFAVPTGNTQMRVGYNVTVNPAIGLFRGTSRLGFISASEDNLSVGFDDGAVLRWGDEPGELELNGSQLRSFENSPTWGFTSGDVPLTANSSTVVIHGLEEEAVYYSVELKCTADDAGWEATDRIPDISGNPGITVGVSGGSLSRIKLTVGGSISILHEDTSALTIIDMTKWVAIVRVGA